jgi:LysM repeat protein
MSFLDRLRLSLIATLLITGLAGCSPPGDSQQDEEKEPHYVLGASRVKALDFDGAVEAFEEALEVDPHSAAAHFELGWLYDEKVSDPAAAIYHYQQFLKFNPKADNAQIVVQRINSCKQQLAANSLELPSTPAAQQQLEHLVEQNRQLQQQVDQLQGVIKQWNAYYASVQAAQAAQPTQPRPAPSANTQPATGTVSPTPDDISAAPNNGSPIAGTQPEVPNDGTASARPAPRATAHTSTSTTPASSTSSRSSKHSHTVQSGETLASIARKAGVSLAALEDANPGINPKKLRAGQIVTIP